MVVNVMKLKKDEIVLRTWQKKDADIILKWWDDGEIMAHAGFPLGLGTTKEKIEKMIEAPSKKERLIIEIAENKAGELCFEPLCDTVCEIGIKICEKEYQNHGYGTKVLTMLIDYLFHECTFNKIVLDTCLENVRAQHVYEKLGFVKIGIRENCWKDQLGVMRTALDYELTNIEWERR